MARSEERGRDGLRQTETDRDRQRQTETDRDRQRQRQTETDRDRQRQTETDRDRQTRQEAALCPCCRCGCVNKTPSPSLLSRLLMMMCLSRGNSAMSPLAWNPPVTPTTFCARQAAGWWLALASLVGYKPWPAGLPCSGSIATARSLLNPDRHARIGGIAITSGERSFQCVLAFRSRLPADGSGFAPNQGCLAPTRT
jgi:hypothetical protein